MKKIIAFVLTALMVIGMIPVTALIASADTPPVGAHTKVVVGEYVDPDTQATVDCFTVIGFVAKDKIDDMEFLDMNVEVYPYGSDKSNPVNSFHKAFTKVFSSLKDIAATDQNTALTQNVEYVDVPDVYIFGLTVYGVPQGLYTIDVTVTGRSMTGAPIDGLVGKAEDVSFGVDDELPAEIVDAAYALTDGTLENKTLTGKIVDIGTAYSTQYENITVTIAVAGRENKPIQCYRLKGAAATDTTPAVDISGLALFDTITVTGTLKNYKGTIEFDQGCVCSAIVKSTSNVPAALDAITLEQTYNPGDAVTPAAGNQYPDVTFTYAAAVAEGDAPVVIDNGTLTFGNVTAATQITVTVTATDGTETLSKEFNVSLVPAGHTETMQDIVDAAYALAPGASLAEQKTLQGVITEITTAYSAQYGNVTVVIAVADRTDKPIQCYRMKNGENITEGEGVEVIKVGDTITVTGTLKNYSGTIEFDKNCTLDSIDAAAQLTDEQKVEAEKDALNVTIADGTALPTTGATYTDVAIDWESNNAMVAVDSGAVVINNTLQAGDEDVTVTVTATLWLNDAEMTKTFTVVLKAPSAQAGTTVVVVSEDLGYANSEEVQTITADSVVTITYDKADGTNAPKYYTSGTAIRAYSGNTITISGTKKITKIVLNFAGTNYTGSMTLDGYSCDSAVGTWTGNADSVTFTVGTTQARIVSFEITYGDEDANQGGTTPTVTDAEKVQAEYDALNVVIENGTVLPSVGTTYADVAITWASDNEMVTLTGGVVAINNTLTFTDSDVTVTVTAALSIGETVQDKTFTVVLEAPYAPAATTVVVVSEDLGYANAEEVQTITADSVVTITYDKADGTNAPKYYTSGTAIRAYGGNTITISGTKKITKIVLNFAGTGYTGTMTLDGYSCDSAVGTWTGNADSVTFTVGTTQARIVSFEITYGYEDANQGGTTPTVTDAEKVQAEYDALNVVIENGTVLPSVGTTYTDVAITWASDNEMVTLTGGVVAINNTLTFADSDVTVTVTAALSIGETVQNKTFTVELKAPQQGNDPAQTVKDTLTADLFAAASTTYTDFANVSATSDAVYAGQSAKTTGGAIQLRSKNSNSGIVTTTTGGKVVSITVKFESGSNTLDIYGSNTAYTDATDLYDSDKQGTKIGSIYADGTVTVEGDYTYIGFRSSNGALYITSIEIEWA